MARAINPRLLASVLVLFTAAAQVRATPLFPGTAPVVPDSLPYTGGSVVADSGLLPFNFAGNTGTVREIVYRGDTNNPFGSGALDFILQVTSTTGVVGRITNASFGAFLTDVGMAAGTSPLAAGTVAATSANRSADGTVVGFNFQPEFGGATSLALIIRTNATDFTTGSIGVIDGGAQTLSGFAPVPEPGTLGLIGLLGAGLAGSSLWRRRQFAWHRSARDAMTAHDGPA